MTLLKKILATVILAAPLAVMAQTPAPRDPLATPGIDNRQANQEQRIQQGVQSGAITPKEAAQREKGQAHIENMEAKAKADGKVTPREREHLQQAQDRQSRKIHHEKHDRQHDYNHDGKKDHPQRGQKH